MYQRKSRRCQSAAALLSAVLSLAVVACGSDDDTAGDSTAGATSPTTGAGAQTTTGSANGVDVGTGTPIPVTRVEDLKVAFITAGLANPLGVKQEEGIKKAAEKYGISVTTFDPGFDPARQFALYQNVTSGGEFNAIITLPLNGAQSCDILSETAPSKGIIVSIVTLPICGREIPGSAIGDGLWAPGTLNTVGIPTGNEALEAVATECEAQAETGAPTIILNAPATVPSAKKLQDAFEATSLDVLENYETDYSAEDGNAKTAAALRTHPDLKVIATTNPQVAFGAIAAIKAAGKVPGTDVILCDLIGGSEQTLDLIKSGELAVDQYLNNVWLGMAAMQSIVDAVEGKPGPRVIAPGPDGAIEQSDGSWPAVITKDNVDEFAPNGE